MYIYICIYVSFKEACCQYLYLIFLFFVWLMLYMPFYKIIDEDENAIFLYNISKCFIAIIFFKEAQAW